VTVGLGRNPGKRYASHSRRGRRGVGMRRSCPIPASPPQRFRPLPERRSALSAPSFHPLTSTKSPKREAPASPEKRAAALEIVLRRKADMPKNFVAEFTEHADDAWITANGAQMVA